MAAPTTPPSPAEIIWQDLARGTRIMLAVAGAGGLAVGLAGALWLAVARPVPQLALILAVVGFGLLIQALGIGPNRVRTSQGRSGVPRPVGTRTWYYGLSVALMVLAVLEVGVGLIALGQPPAVRVLVLSGAGLSAFTAVIAALSTADLTKYVAGAKPPAPQPRQPGRQPGRSDGKGGAPRSSGARGGAGAGRRPSKSRSRAKRKRR